VAFTNGDDTWSTLAPEQLPQIAGRADAVLQAVIERGRDGVGGRTLRRLGEFEAADTSACLARAAGGR
jgi:hypothetical protein